MFEIFIYFVIVYYYEPVYVAGPSMPIKYNLTKYDMLAEQYHDLSQKKVMFTPAEELIKAQAVLIAAFSSSHSWQTNKMITEGDIKSLMTSSDIVIAEHILAKATKWKQVKNMDIQEIARTNISGMFPVWLNSIKVDQNSRATYRAAWDKLQKEVFSAECDGNTVAQRQG